MTYSQKREKTITSVSKKFSLGFSLLVETDRGGCFRVFKDFVLYIYIYIYKRLLLGLSHYLVLKI